MGGPPHTPVPTTRLVVMKLEWPADGNVCPRSRSWNRSPLAAIGRPCSHHPRLHREPGTGVTRRAADVACGRSARQCLGARAKPLRSCPHGLRDGSGSSARLRFTSLLPSSNLPYSRATASYKSHSYPPCLHDPPVGISNIQRVSTPFSTGSSSVVTAKPFCDSYYSTHYASFLIGAVRLIASAALSASTLVSFASFEAVTSAL